MPLQSDPDKIQPLRIHDYPTDHGKALAHDAYKARLMQESIEELSHHFEELASTAKTLLEMCEYYQSRISQIKEDI